MPCGMHRILNKKGRNGVKTRVSAHLLRLESESRNGNDGGFLYLQSKTFSLSLVSFHSKLNLQVICARLASMKKPRRFLSGALLGWLVVCPIMRSWRG